ncbi:isocitrate lyase/PEP mutase family protein [Plantactinospora sonchi]|uniref:Isocitrate lyase/phosphoenolpyruvate mutase family protein n=1 Tax=Plantactinospora sonchi TaxID=1544735 RepID=A0ABU7S6H9_9ACTN
MTAARIFHALHQGDRPFLLPNAWDIPSALLLADAGFPAVGTTSLGVNAAAGVPDSTGDGAELAVALARQLAPRLPVPLTMDLENGYHDDPSRVAALVEELAGCGVAGVNLEDGRADGGLRAPEEHAAVVGAVVAAAPELFVNARTDTYWLRTGADEGARYADTVDRLTRYRDVGASGVFVPGLTDLDRIAAVADAVALPLNVLWSPGADLDALAAARVTRVSTGSALYRHALAAALATATAAGTGTPPPVSPVDYHQLQARLGRRHGDPRRATTAGTSPQPASARLSTGLPPG